MRRSTFALLGCVALAGCAALAAAVAPAPRRPLPPLAAPVPALADDEPGVRRVLPLAPASLARLREATSLRESGQLDSARLVLEGLLIQSPHHPQVLLELARVHEDRHAWSELERLALRERLATHDSTLLAPSLATARERTGRPAAAAQVAVEAWVASPLMGDWAQSTLARLSPAAAKPVREALRRAATQRPERADLARGTARLDWAAGDARAALRSLADADHAGARPPARWIFAEDLLRGGGDARDSTGAMDVLLDLAGDRAAERSYRAAAARRAWEVAEARGEMRAHAPRLAHALADLPSDAWDSAFLVGVARALREGGHTADSRALLAPLVGRPQAPAVSLERALADLRDGPPERALPALRVAASEYDEGAWRYAEALFYAAQSDSARAWYERVSENPASPYAGAAFERLYLIEDADPRSALAAFGRLAYEEWRGEPRRAAELADSLYRSLRRGATWAQAALSLSTLRDALGDPRAALEPLALLADSLPGDRLAPLARQRLGDLYLDRIRDEAQALAQYEECLARYPRAWNAPEVRRRVETLRRDRRF